MQLADIRSSNLRSSRFESEDGDQAGLAQLAEAVGLDPTQSEFESLVQYEVPAVTKRSGPWLLINRQLVALVLTDSMRGFHPLGEGSNPSCDSRAAYFTASLTSNGGCRPLSPLSSMDRAAGLEPANGRSNRSGGAGKSWRKGRLAEANISL